ncbi:MAG TPA: decaprenyl-phosphate phosphoribosyltransferase [Fibrobacteres bacterium]|jgi:4-hydroxybenzoate polyprenyltransferase|nr:decaprenyl-phosphate phosphoribosyltransferase [Fibrobacterota bacterium]
MNSKPLVWLRLLRPSHWIKNLFVLAGVFFSGNWRQPGMLMLAFEAFLAFCLASSAVYSLNDTWDCEVDKNHPRKRLRPIAAGLLSRNTGYLTSGVLILFAMVLGLRASGLLALALAAYIVVNILYSLNLKNRVLLDVFCIAFGFIIRLLAGTWGLGIAPSQWFLLCTLSLSLFLGFSKRYAELIDKERPLEEKRRVLQNYTPEFLRLLLSVTLSASLITYALYTTSSRTAEVHHTAGLIYTLPLVLWGLFRYLYRVMHGGFGENTVADVLRDRQMLLVSLLYLIATGSLLFFGGSG